MKERPILFSAPMVRAILDGTKTQTRRVAKLTANGHVKEPGGHRRWHTADFDARLACPYGQPGDRLWVREAFRLIKTLPGGAAGDSVPPSMVLDSTRKFEADGATSLPDRIFGKLRPGIHMPRWASRITLEITGVRLERLQDISKADSVAEGVCELPLQAAEPGCWWTADVGAGAALHGRTPSNAYRLLWESINGPESWDANPLIWVMEFKRI